MVAGPDGDPRAVEDLGDVVRVDTGQVERNNAASQVRVHRPVQLDPGHGPWQLVQRVGDQLPFVHPDGVPPMYAFDDPDGNRFYIVEES